jgi:membrane-bound hydrogenase subunit beta
VHPQTGSWVEIPADHVRQWVADFMASGKMRLLSTISGYQDGDRIAIVYHFMHSETGALNLRVSVPLAEPVLPSITPALPGGLLYEQEIQDLLGVRFEGILDPRRLILPEDFPQGVYPLRTDYHYHGTEEKETPGQPGGKAA